MFNSPEGFMENAPNLVLTTAYQLATIGIFLLELRKLWRASMQ